MPAGSSEQGIQVASDWVVEVERGQLKLSGGGEGPRCMSFRALE